MDGTVLALYLRIVRVAPQATCAAIWVPTKVLGTGQVIIWEEVRVCVWVAVWILFVPALTGPSVGCDTDGPRVLGALQCPLATG